MPFGEENIISLPLFFCHTKCYTRHNESPQFCPVFHAFGSPAKPRLKGNMYMENEYIIEMLNITKEFPGIKANDNITLQLKKGEIHALLGENGAGKSTLMSILFGLYQPTSGIIKKNGQEVHINTPNDANDLNIGMVHQHFKLVECFSVLDNIILGVEPTKGLFLEKKNARAKVMELSEKYGLMVDPDALISDITVGMQQRTEILKMLYRDNEVLIFDEPTAVLTPQEIDELMKIMKNLAKEGKSILFITHKLNEIMEVADRCTILRKGKYIGTVNISETSKEELSRMMVGRNVSFSVNKKPSKPGDTVLKVEHMTVPSKVHGNNAVKDVSFNVRKGEIIGLAGLDGSGRTEVLENLFGIATRKSGTIRLDGKQVLNRNARESIKNGFALLTEERRATGIFGILDIRENTVISNLKNYRSKAFPLMLDDKKMRQDTQWSIDAMHTKTPTQETKIRSLSGGNQQKVILGRWLLTKPEVLLLDEPTRGIDVGAKYEIYQLIIDLANEGKVVIMVSSEMPELLGVCDRILVMSGGRLAGEVDARNTTQEEIMTLAAKYV